jgi:hypothetical protein
MADTTIAAYDPAPVDDLQGAPVATGLANVKVKYQSKDNPNTNKWAARWGRRLGLLEGDTTVEDILSVFNKKSGMIAKSLGNVKTGLDTKLRLPLTHLTPYAKNLMRGSDLPFEVSYTTYPGTRTYTSGLSGPFVTSNQFALTFNTTNISTGVTGSNTVVSVTFSSDDATTKAAVISAIEANTGISAANTAWSSNTLTIKAAAGYYITIVSGAAITGGTPPTVTNTATDTSIVTGTIDNATSTIDYLSFGVLDATGFRKGQMIEVLTGNSDTGTDYEYPHIDRVDSTNNIIYLAEGFELLPEDAVEIKVVADIEYRSGGNVLPDPIQLRLEADVHTSESKELTYFWTAQLVEKSGPTKTAEGEKGELVFDIIPERVPVDGVARYEPYLVKEINSIAGTY